SACLIRPPSLSSLARSSTLDFVVPPVLPSLGLRQLRSQRPQFSHCGLLCEVAVVLDPLVGPLGHVLPAGESGEAVDDGEVVHEPGNAPVVDAVLAAGDAEQHVVPIRLRQCHRSPPCQLQRPARPGRCAWRRPGGSTRTTPATSCRARCPTGPSPRPCPGGRTHPCGRTWPRTCRAWPRRRLRPPTP